MKTNANEPVSQHQKQSNTPLNADERRILYAASMRLLALRRSCGLPVSQDDLRRAESLVANDEEFLRHGPLFGAVGAD